MQRLEERRELGMVTKPVLSIADEGRALRNVMWMWWITAVTYNSVAIPVIWDPAQHSFIIRDSTWTPPHLMIFGPMFALMLPESIIFGLYMLKKAQPYIRKEIPITLWLFPTTVFAFTLGSMLTNELGQVQRFFDQIPAPARVAIEASSAPRRPASWGSAPAGAAPSSTASVRPGPFCSPSSSD